MSRAPQIFISHSHADNEFCQRLASDLRRALGSEKAVWLDTAGGLRGGDTWWATIREELRRREVFLVVLSPKAAESSWVNSEVDIAWKLRQSDRSRRIIPLVCQPCRMRDDLDTLQCISFVARPYDEAFAQLCAALHIALPTPALAEPVAPPAPPLIAAPVAAEMAPEEPAGPEEAPAHGAAAPPHQLAAEGGANESGATPAEAGLSARSAGAGGPILSRQPPWRWWSRSRAY